MLLAVFSLTACRTSGPAGLSEADRAAIEATSKAFVEGVNAKDWAAVAATYTEDAALMPPNGPSVEGRANIQAFVEAFPPISDFNFEIIEVEGQGDMAYVRGTYTMTITPEGGDPITDTGKYIEIRKKQADGSWKVQVDCFNADGPPTAAEES
ncbi:MAG: SgcJ/EcaC family oxidoreductase [Nitrospirae bacterium]|nr:SgcJ/EcaC family oxidoreductase [Nitrospirota bacterium]